MVKKGKLFVGITGGIGTGKSLFAKFLESKGEIVLNADKTAKEIMESDKNVIKSLKRILGNKAYYITGKLNTNYISEIIFSDINIYKKVNSVVHSATIIKLTNTAKKILKTRNLVFTEAALIFESGMDKKLDYVILIKSPLSVRLQRITERDGMTHDEFYKRIQYQIDPDTAEQLAQFTIINDSTIEDFNKKSQFIYNIIKMLSNNQ